MEMCLLFHPQNVPKSLKSFLILNYPWCPVCQMPSKKDVFYANLGKLGEQMPSKCTVSHHASSKLWGQLVASAPASTKATTWLRRRRPTPASAAANSSSSNLQPHDIIPEASQKMLQPEIKFHLRLNAVGMSLWYIAAMIQGLICKTWQNLQLTIGNNG